MSTEPIQADPMDKYYLWTFGGVTYNLRDRSQRDIAVRQLLSIRWDDEYCPLLDFEGDQEIISKSIAHTISLEIVHHPELFKRALKEASNHQHFHFALIYYGSVVFGCDILFRRRFFKHQEDELWKSYITASLKLFSRWNRMAHKDQSQDPMMRRILAPKLRITFFIDFVHTMRWWNCSHFRFAIEHGLYDVIARIVHNATDFNSLEEVVTLIIAFLNELEHHYPVEGKNIKQLCMDWVVGGLLHLGEIEAKAKSDAFSLLLVKCSRRRAETRNLLKINKVFKDQVVISFSGKNPCEWPLCKKIFKRNPYRVKYKCGGCRLVRYCSRRCQKKHWKCIHSQQCLSCKQP